jgi:predicted ribosomally synthesized peptide with SipW-like signal peptide
MKKILLSVFLIALVVSLAAGATYSQFIDTETSEDNTFSTGSLDLTVDGENDPLSFNFQADNMLPGNTYSGGCVELANAGSSDGILTLKVQNPVSNENGELEPELSDGDVVDTEIDPSGYDANSGYGELWDQLTVRFFIDDGAGSHTGNGVWDWDDTAIYSNFGTPSVDYSSYYSLPLDSDLVGGDITLSAGQSATFCTEVHFVDDQSNWWWGAQNGLTNNMAMSDDVVFDIVFGLEQVAP